MKGKTFKTLLSLLVVTAMIAASGCSMIEDTNERPNRDDTTSQSGRTTPGSGGDGTVSIGDNDVAKVNNDNNGEKTLLYVTGIEKNIALRESDSVNGKVLAQLSLKDEVELIDDSSDTCCYVRYIKDNISGYVTKEYLTEEKDAACKRENAYIAKQTPIYNSKEDDKSEIEKLNKNDEIYIVSKNSGDYWFVYSKKDKVFGFVKSMDISSSKIQDTSSAQTQSKAATSSQAQTQQQTQPQTQPQTTPNTNSGYYTGAGSAPSNYTTYYAKVNTGYLAIRTAKAYDDSNIIGQMYTGDKVYVIDTSTGTYWYCYSPTNGVYGYVNSGYLVSSKPSSGSSGGGSVSSGYTTWTVGNTNSAGGHYLALRSAPAYDASNEKGKLYDGQVVYVYSYSYASYYDTYWYVYAPSLGQWGYVNSNYIWS